MVTDHQQFTVCLATQFFAGYSGVEYLPSSAAMPAEKKPIWKFFLPGNKQNGSHQRAHCRGCIEAKHPEGDPIQLDEDGKVDLASESWVIQGE